MSGMMGESPEGTAKPASMSGQHGDGCAGKISDAVDNSQVLQDEQFADGGCGGSAILATGMLHLDDEILQPGSYDAECAQKSKARRAKKEEAQQLRANSQKMLKTQQKAAIKEKRKLEAAKRQKKNVVKKNQLKKESQQYAQPSLERAESQFALYDKCQDELCAWLTDVHRRDTFEERGLGIFATREIPEAKPVAKYQGHLVHPDGSVAIRCTLTAILFLSIPHLESLPFSRGHCASVFGKGTSSCFMSQ
jgi:hypothetical protein